MRGTEQSRNDSETETSNCCGSTSTNHAPAASARCGGHGHEATPAVTKAIDPVCGMTVDPATAKHRFDYEGTTYYFCCAGCRSTFAADPAGVLAKAAQPLVLPPKSAAKPKADLHQLTDFAAPAACCGGHDHGGHDHAHHHHDAAPAAGKAIDPVCGMTVDPATAKHRFDYQGQTYYFCAARCRGCRARTACCS